MSEGHTERLETALDGKYRIERKLGEGGMATVYLAEDIKHKRNVALKILRPELAAVIGADRFLAEITTTANLQHPHILPLFDSGAADNYLYYVMPFIDGETLGQKLSREKQLGVEEAVKIAKEVGDALDYAHRNGVIHRDIKPANILLNDGRPVVADFGIALAVSAAGGGRMTETGLSLGTPHYMSPEQASADRDLSARSDVYSLGCVLYEMIAGQPPHTGPSAQSILVRILTEDPRPLTEMRHTVPPNVAATVAKAIEKLPADRFETARHFIDALEDIDFTYQPAARTRVTPTAGTTRPVEARVERSSRMTVAFAVLSLALSGVLAWGLFGPEVPAPVLRADLNVGDISLQSIDRVIISPDGSTFAVSGDWAGGRMLFVRNSDEVEFRPLPGTDEALTPAFSPEGDWIIYLDGSDRAIRKVALAGGQPLTVVAAGVGEMKWSPHWGDDGTVVFHTNTGLYRVSAAGGTPTLLLSDPDVETPKLLPGGKAVVFTRQGSISLLDLATDSVRVLVVEGVDASYLPTGHLLFAHPAGGLQAVAFDRKSFELAGDPVPVLDGVARGQRAGAYFAVSDQGTLVYMSGRVLGYGSGFGADQLVVVDVGTGGTQGIPLERREWGHPRYSPDGRLVAFESGDPNQIFVYDIELGTSPRQVTFEGTSAYPVWSPDGTRLAFASVREGSDERDIFVKTVADDTPEVPMSSRPGEQVPLHWPTEDRLLFGDDAESSTRNLWMLNPAEDGAAEPYLRSEARLSQATVSPDGRRIAYESNESGEPAIYVRSFPEPGQQTRVSPGRGQSPRWSPDGNAIYYWNAQGNDTLRVSNVGTEPPFPVLSTDVVLFGTVYGRAELDVHPDGERLIVVNDVAQSLADGSEEGEASRHIVVTNWFQELRARLSGGG